jgi:DNA mismatch repair protein MutL
LILEAVEKALHPGGVAPAAPFNFAVDYSPAHFIPQMSSPPVMTQPPQSDQPMIPRPPTPQPSIPTTAQPTLFSAAPSTQAAPTPKVLTTIPGYLVVDPQTVDRFASGSLCLVDQRAAHARVIFERVSACESNPIASQSLLIPYTWEAAPAEAALLRLHIDSLNRLGVGIKEFGQHTFLVDALPSVCGNIEIQGFIAGLLDRLQMHDEDAPRGEREAKALAASAAAVTRARKLPYEEAQALLQQLMRCKNPYYCPQGKPTMMAFSSEELAKQFVK